MRIHCVLCVTAFNGTLKSSNAKDARLNGIVGQAENRNGRKESTGFSTLDYFSNKGISTVNTLPFPKTLSTFIFPLCASTTVFT